MRFQYSDSGDRSISPISTKFTSGKAARSSCAVAVLVVDEKCDNWPTLPAKLGEKDGPRQLVVPAFLKRIL